jgi:hypothetical protein
MKFNWEKEDIVGGLNIIQPEKGTTAIIGWMGSSGDKRSVIVETNTDGKVHFQYKKNDSGVLEKYNNELIPECFTKEELADKLNSATYHWVPASLFKGNGARLLHSGVGVRKETKGAYKTLKEK